MSGSQPFIEAWKSRHNYSEIQDEEILEMSLKIKALEACTDILEGMMADKNGQATMGDDHMGAL